MNPGRIFLKYKLHHVLIWILVGVLWYYLRFQDYRTSKEAILVTAIKVADLAMLIYIANYLLIPRLLYKKHYLFFFLAFISMIVVSSFTKMYVIGRITDSQALLNWSGHIKSRIYDNVIPHFFLVIAGVAIQLLLDYTRVQKRLVEVAKERAEAELNFLKSQINPHFLFNSLNSVYFLIDKNNVQARDALHKFSDMLRYQLYELKDQKIPIEKEISYLRDYIDLQRLRVNENYTVKMEVEPGIKNFFIEPLLLMPFVENSFKHLSHFSNGIINEILINLSKENGEMKFSVKNTMEEKKSDKNSSTGGIGLVNVKRRLELLYPDQHNLQITSNEGWFDVNLTIKTGH